MWRDTDGQRDSQTDGWTDGQTDMTKLKVVFAVLGTRLRYVIA
jgi:hypothetical protein